MGSLVKNACHRAEGFLASCVPDLQLTDLIVELDDERAEFNANGHLVLNFELLIHDPR